MYLRRSSSYGGNPLASSACKSLLWSTGKTQRVSRHVANESSPPRAAAGDSSRLGWYRAERAAGRSSWLFDFEGHALSGGWGLLRAGSGRPRGFGAPCMAGQAGAPDLAEGWRRMVPLAWTAAFGGSQRGGKPHRCGIDLEKVRARPERA